MSRSLNLLSPDRLRVHPATSLAELRVDIMRSSYIEGDFELTGGLRRNYYVDKYLFSTRPAILRRLGRFIAARVPAHTERVAAPALGAVALGAAVSLEMGLPLVLVQLDRPEGTGVEGELFPGEAVTLIEDVVVTGKRALEAVAALTERGARVTDVIAVLDREEGAAARIAELSINYHWLFLPADLGITS